MRVLVAGATGAVGLPIVAGLIADGHEPVGLVRSGDGAARLAAVGVASLRADVLDRSALLRSVEGHAFDAVVHELTALKKAPARFADMRQTNVLRTQGTANLLEAAHLTGARRFVNQSIVFGYGFTDHGTSPITEADPFGRSTGDRFTPIIDALAAAENQVFDDPGVKAIALRYGLFYGRDITTMAELLRKRRLPVTSATGTLALIHHDDAAAATVAAIERGHSNTAYNIVDDTPTTWTDYVRATATAMNVRPPRSVPGWVIRAAAPYAGHLATRVSMTVSSAAAHRDLHWRPQYRSCVDGLHASAALART